MKLSSDVLGRCSNSKSLPSLWKPLRLLSGPVGLLLALFCVLGLFSVRADAQTIPQIPQGGSKVFPITGVGRYQGQVPFTWFVQYSNGPYSWVGVATSGYPSGWSVAYQGPMPPTVTPNSLLAVTVPSNAVLGTYRILYYVPTSQPYVYTALNEQFQVVAP